MDYNKALDILKKGNQRFVEQKTNKKQTSNDERDKLLQGQQPYAAIIGCSDSRVAPEIIFDTGLNELFIIRNAGNVATDVELASVEYALLHLGVKLVMVLGHEKCGAVSAVCDMSKKGELDCSHSFKAILNEILPSVKKNEGQEQIKERTEYDNARHTKQKLVENPAINELTVKGEVAVVCGRYSIATGVVEFFE